MKEIKKEFKSDIWRDSFRWKFEGWPFFTSVYMKLAVMNNSGYYVRWTRYICKFSSGHGEHYTPKEEILSKGHREIKELIAGDDSFAKEFRNLSERMDRAIALCFEVREDNRFKEINYWWPTVQNVLSDVSGLLFGFDYALGEWMNKLQVDNPVLFNDLSLCIRERKESFINQAKKYLDLLMNKYPDNFDQVYADFMAEFSWFQNSYSGKFNISREWLMDFYEQNKKSDGSVLINEDTKIPEGYELLVDIASEAIIFRDNKKKLLLLAVDLMEAWLRDICTNNDISFDEMKWLSVYQVQEVLKGNKDLLARAKNYAKNNELCGVMLEDGYEDVPQSLFAEVQDLFLGGAKLTELTGSIGNKGKITGTAKIIQNAKADGSKLEAGDILITSMTRPEFLPLMNRASAFVTDEGGVTCHAAIVAREMRKPCIIGTRIATQILKDGDIIEVNADKGIVRIIK